MRRQPHGVELAALTQWRRTIQALGKDIFIALLLYPVVQGELALLD